MYSDPIFGDTVEILVTNDDGVHSQGLQLLVKGLQKLGKVTVVAPDRERNAVSHALTLHKPLRIEKIGRRVYKVSGTPTDCVNVGMNEILKERPGLVVSGINQGGNLGDDVTYSGTVSGALEGTIFGIPSVAISLVGNRAYQFKTAVILTFRLVHLILKYGLPEDTLLNVNVPNLPLKDIKGVRFTRLGRRVYNGNNIIAHIDPRGKRYYWIGENRVSWQGAKDADYYAVQKKMVSITPIHLDLTNYEALEQLRYWEDRLKFK